LLCICRRKKELQTNAHGFRSSRVGISLSPSKTSQRSPDVAGSR
jgi:hypothetical protein